MSLVTRATRLALITLLTASNSSIAAQTATPAPQKDSIAVTLAIEKKEVLIGQMPWAILTVRNLTDHDLAIHSYMYRVHVDGKNGEAPTKLAQRRLTDKLRPGEQDLRGDEYVVWTIAPGKSDVRKFQLAYLYDLSAPGTYTAYAEVMDPSSQKLVRTNTVTFAMQTPPQ